MSILSKLLDMLKTMRTDVTPEMIAESARSQLEKAIRQPGARALAASPSKVLEVFMSAGTRLGDRQIGILSELTLLVQAMSLHLPGEARVESTLSPEEWGTRQTLGVYKGAVHLATIIQHFPVVTAGAQPIHCGISFTLHPGWLEPTVTKMLADLDKASDVVKLSPDSN